MSFFDQIKKGMMAPHNKAKQPEPEGFLFAITECLIRDYVQQEVRGELHSEKPASDRFIKFVEGFSESDFGITDASIKDFDDHVNEECEYESAAEKLTEALNANPRKKYADATKKFATTLEELSKRIKEIVADEVSSTDFEDEFYEMRDAMVLAKWQEKYPKEETKLTEEEEREELKKIIKKQIRKTNPEETDQEIEEALNQTPTHTLRMWSRQR